MIEFPAPNIVRIIRDSKEKTHALVEETIEQVHVEEIERDEGKIYRTKELEVLIRKNNLIISRYKNEVVFEELKFERKGNGFIWMHKICPEEARIYGFGEKGGPLNKRGWKRLKILNRDPIYKYRNPDTDPLYLNIPFYIMVAPKKFAVGIFVHNTYYMKIDPGKKEKNAVIVDSPGGNLDAFVIIGDDVKEVLRYYTELTGRIFMPPLWSLGFHQSKWSYMSEEEVMKVANKFRELNLPCDAIHLDIDYMDGFRVFTWNKLRFPNPKELISKLHEMGFKIVVIQDPYVKADDLYPLYKEGLSKNYFVKTRNGNVFYGNGWPGKSAIPDFTKDDTREWWGYQYVKFHEDYGVDGYWNDMNEPSFVIKLTSPFGSDIKKAVFYDNGKMTGIEKNGNIYALLEDKATIDGLRKGIPNKRFFLLSRSGFAGIQRYAAVWTGDVWSNWEHLRRSISMLLGLGLSGVPFVGADIGGFAPPFKVKKKLYVRWIQLGTFYPFMRIHYMKKKPAQEPWAFDNEVLRIARMYIEFRYRILPYIYSLFWEAHNTGTPIMRPLFMEFSEDEKSYDIQDEFMFGPFLLVAPVTANKEEREVYLPKGIWYDYWQKEIITSTGTTIKTPVPLDRIPIYVRNGAIIPMQEVVQYVGEKEIERIELLVFAKGDVSSSFTVYEDDGKTFDYEKGKYNELEVIINGENKIELKVRHRDYETKIKTIRFIMIGREKPKVVKFNGEEIQFEFYEESNELIFEIPYLLEGTVDLK